MSTVTTTRGTKSENEISSPQPLKVAVIGCGPGGMSFLHAVETRRQKLIEEGDVDGLSKLPIVTVFERNSHPGGVWRSHETNDTRYFKPDANDEEEVQSTEDSIEVVVDEVVEKEASLSVSLQPIEKVKREKDIISSEDNTVVSDSGYSSASPDPYVRAEEEEEGKEGVEDEESDDEEYDYIVEGRTSSSTCMYEALWTNGPCQGIEFSDYTFAEHFNKSLPVFLPRSEILNYLLARVTKNCPTFFDAVQFNTTVELVDYNQVDSKFKIKTKNEKDGRKVEFFDKCIWAAGANGCAKIPKSIRMVLQEGKFKGLDVHSSQAAKHFDDLKGKKIVMIGDGLSAEDLVLQAIKVGVEEIYIVARSGNGVCSSTSAWPEDKVDIFHDRLLTGVSDNGTGLRFAKMEYDVLKDTCEITDKNDVIDIEDVSAVIYCTGYEENVEMLGDSLWDDSYEDNDDCYDNLLPKDWTMNPNLLTEIVGEVKPNSTLRIDNDYMNITTTEYRGISIHNPNLMYLNEGCASYPLLEIDVRAWYYLAVIMGEIVLPSEAEVIAEHSEILRQGMQLPLVRYCLDAPYEHAIREAYEIEENEWIADFGDERYHQMNIEAMSFTMGLLGDEMRSAKYPCQLLGLDGALNEKGKLLTDMTVKCYGYRGLQEENTRETFRDIDPSSFRSLHTGRQARRLKALWLDIDDRDADLLQLEKDQDRSSKC